MPNWSESMQQIFEYYIVDPGTWKDVKRINNVIDSKITRDETVETLGSLSMNIGEPIGEEYIRVYLITIQNGIKEKHPLGTFLIQTPSYSFDGKTRTSTLDAYTPLLELKENPPPIGYSILKGSNIMEFAYRLVRENVRAPIIKTEKEDLLQVDFVSNSNDTWISFIYDLIANARYTIGLDEMGRIIFLPKQDVSSLKPIWYYDDSNSSLLLPNVEVQQDLYGIPNVVEIIYSDGNKNINKKIVNDDPNSPTSTVARGREIVYREINPSNIGNPTEEQLEYYAKNLLKNLSSIEYTITYTHGYCPVRIGDCVMLNYEKAGIKNVKARVITQNIDCTPGCLVTETAVFTDILWRG